MRTDGDDRYLFVCHGKPENYFEASSFLVDSQYMVEFSVKGQWGVELLDTFTGRIMPVASEVRSSKTFFTLPSYEHSSFLFRLKKESITAAQPQEKELLLQRYLPSVNAYRLEEPNTLVLDQAQWKLDDGPWQEKEEILKIDDAIRRQLGLRLRTDSFPQPWLSGGVNEKNHVVELRYNIESHVALDMVSLDLKQALSFLSEITATDPTETLITEIFSTFCVGK